MTGRDAPPAIPLLTAAEMRAWDAAAIDALGVPERVLMESAGRAAALFVARNCPSGRIVAAIGRGNNGGDAVVMLRSLAAWGRDVVAVPVGETDIPAGLLHGWKIPVDPDLAAACRGAGVVVDGILGTGATGGPRPPAAEAVEVINGCGAVVVALDGPTGVDLSDGSVAGAAVRADVTITFGAPKRGLLLQPGRSHAGRVVVVETGFPPYSGDAPAALVTAEWAAARLPRVAPDAHKGAVGELLVVAGGGGMGGAAIMTAMGALRAGAGLVRVSSAGENRLALHAAVPEAVFVGDDVEAGIEASDAVAIGPGLGTGEDARATLGKVLAADLPTLLDADALNLLAGDPAMLRDGGDHLLLTPHPGEAARLLEVGIRDVTRAPFDAALAIAERFGCAVLLKGAPSMVAAPGAQTLVGSTGHSGVATGGMGDTLSGIAGALLAAGLPPREAGAVALHFAGRAAELAGRGRSLLPRDVADALPDSLMEAPGRLEPGVLLDLRAAS